MWNEQECSELEQFKCIAVLPFGVIKNYIVALKSSNIIAFTKKALSKWNLSLNKS